MKSLSGVDGVFLHLETAQTPMHVASLHLFDLPAGVTAGDFLAEVRRQMRRRVRIARPPQGMDFNDMLTGQASRIEEGAQ